MSGIGRFVAPAVGSRADLAQKAPKPARTPTPIERTEDVRLLPQEHFLHTLCLERKRTERSRRRFVLMLLAAPGLLRNPVRTEAIEKLAGALSRSIRETDVKGWYKEKSTIGVIFTEIGADADGQAVAKALLARISRALASVLSIDQIKEITVSIHVFPDHWDNQDPSGPADRILYPDRMSDGGPNRTARSVKRMIDVLGSLFALALCAPLLVLLAALIKLTSKGPILFRQERLGLHGAPFQFLKFRSMYLEPGENVHKDYMRSFISGKAGKPPSADDGGVYKITQDSRVTPIGKLLRRTSLDEFPQFFNVLKGEMSLVGPRPPIAYEVAWYETWHRERLLAAIPGITGLWQVEGRSRVPFDEMVRLDLRYANTWSLWLDLKILWRTPRAVLEGEGAY